jgi:hypothetical protein
MNAVTVSTSEDPKTLYVVAIKPFPNDPWCQCLVAWLLCGPNGSVIEESKAHKLNIQPGPELRALVERATAILSRLQDGTRLRLVSDFASFWKAFHPDFGWLAAWRNESFRKRPKHDGDAWKLLSDTALERQISFDASPSYAITCQDRGILDALKRQARDALWSNPEEEIDDEAGGCSSIPVWRDETGL